MLIAPLPEVHRHIGAVSRLRHHTHRVLEQGLNATSGVLTTRSLFASPAGTELLQPMISSYALLQVRFTYAFRPFPSSAAREGSLHCTRGYIPHMSRTFSLPPAMPLCVWPTCAVRAKCDITNQSRCRFQHTTQCIRSISMNA
jgi:hypothetical protein